MAITKSFSFRKKITSFIKHCGKLAGEFCSNTSMHGLKYIVEHESVLIERIAWILVFLGGSCFSGYFCWQMWQKWEESPIIESLDSHLFSFGSVAFPAVTLCNVNKVSHTKLKRALNNSEVFSNVSFDVVRSTLRYMTKLDRAIGNEEELESLSRYYSSRNISSQHMLDLLMESAPSCSEIILDCNWAGLTEQCMDQFEFVPTDDGICCTFNGRRTDQFNPPKKLLNVTGKGYRTGLSLVLNAKVEDYTVTNGKFDGFRVLVHSPDEFADVADRGFVLGPGFEMFVGLKRTSSFSTEDVISKVSPFKRKCQADGERTLEYYKMYSQSACFTECATRRMQDVCSCRPYFYKVEEEIPLCPMSSFSCISSVLKEIEQDWQRYCDCLPSCSGMSYDPEISYAPFPGHGVNLTRTFKRIVSALNLTKEADYKTYFKANVAVLHVYPKDMNGVRFKTDIRFGVEDFISAIGGLLGLGLGFSFISFIEIIYFCCVRHHILRYRIKQTESKTRTTSLNLSENQSTTSNF